MELTTATAATLTTKTSRRPYLYSSAGLLALTATVIALVLYGFTALHAAQRSPSDIALDDIPPPALDAYIAAATECDGLTWNVLAGIGKVESNHGRIFGGTIDTNGNVEPPIFGAALNGSGAGGNTTPWPAGQWQGQWGLTGPWLRALGPMQFISPSWATHGTDANGDSTANPHNIYDATRGAARLLCSSQGGTIANTRDALFSYNRSTQYGTLVLHWAQLYTALPTGLGAGTAVDLLQHRNIELSPQARLDVEAGIIDPRLIATLVAAGEDFQIYIGWFKTGHAMCVGGGDTRTRPNCTISNHFYGRAADIGAVGYANGPRTAVNPNNEAARALTTRFGTLPATDPLRPESLGSPWDTGVYQGHFADGNHNDHLHVAWRTTPPPPPNINQTRHGITQNPNPQFPTAKSGTWFPPVVLPTRTTTITATPDTIQRAIDTATPNTRIQLAAGLYRPIHIRNRTNLSIRGPQQGTATFRANSRTHAAAITIEHSTDIDVSAITATESLWGIQIRNAHDVTITGNTVTNLGQEAIHIADNSTHITVANNTISHTGLRQGTDPEQGLPYRTYGEGIYIGTGRGPHDTTNNVTITGNHIHHTSSEAIDIKTGTHTIHINRNIIHDIATQTSGAIVVHLGPEPTQGPTTIVGNLIWNITSTTQFNDGNAIVASGPARIEANIIWDTQHRGVLIEDVHGPNRTVSVTRNVIFDTPHGTVVTNDHTPAPNTATITDNLDHTILQHPAFGGGWITGDQPTHALASLVEQLENPAIPTQNIPDLLAHGSTAPAWENVNPRRPGDWPIRNTNLDQRTQFIDTPAHAIDWQNLTEPSERTIALGPRTPTKHLGQFRTQCSFSHFAYDDPLVHPSQPGAAHLHMFFGNTLADANSTYLSMRDSGSSTCNGFEANRTGYWVPAVFDAGGNARIPSRIEVYYKTHSNQAAQSIQPPQGLAMIAGTAATNREIEWACQETGAQGQNLNRPIQQRQNTIPRCSRTATLLAHIKFPQCLRNPETVDANTGDVSDQLSYPTGGFFHGNCPTGTTYIWAIEYFIAWSPNNHDGRTDQWWLSSDIGHHGQQAPNGSTLHGDWLGAWNPTLATQIHNNCIGRLAECSWDLIANNQRLQWIEHFGPRHTAAYAGPKAIPAANISQLLCPGDTFNTPTDAATCETQQVGYGTTTITPANTPAGLSASIVANTDTAEAGWGLVVE